MQLRGGARSRCALIAVILAACAVAPALSVSAGAATTASFTVTQKAPVAYHSLYAVDYRKSGANTGTVSGQLPATTAATSVTLQARRFPFSTPFKKVQQTTTDSTGKFAFTVRPTLATEYKATSSTATSQVVTFYVLAGYKQLKTPVCTTRPKCTAVGVYREFYPRAVAKQETSKRFFLYQKVRGSCCTMPPPPTKLIRSTTATVKQWKINATTYRVRLTFHLLFRKKRYSYRWSAGACRRETEATDGFGLPRHFGPCRAHAIPFIDFSKHVVG